MDQWTWWRIRGRVRSWPRKYVGPGIQSDPSSFQVIARTTNPAMHKQLLRELKFLDACTSPYIVAHYGSFLVEKDSQIGILMEYCEGGSLDSLVSKMKKRNMWCSEHVLGRIASSVSLQR